MRTYAVDVAVDGGETLTVGVEAKNLTDAAAAGLAIVETMGVTGTAKARRPSEDEQASPDVEWADPVALAEQERQAEAAHWKRVEEDEIIRQWILAQARAGAAPSA